MAGEGIHVGGVDWKVLREGSLFHRQSLATVDMWGYGRVLGLGSRIHEA